MADRPTLAVECPCCRASLTVDPATGDVLLHKEAKASAEFDIDKAKQALKEGAGRRAELFQKSLEEQKRKGSRLEKQFEEGLKKAKEDPSSPPPLREIDID